MLKSTWRLLYQFLQEVLVIIVDENAWFYSRFSYKSFFWESFFVHYLVKLDSSFKLLLVKKCLNTYVLMFDTREWKSK